MNDAKTLATLGLKLRRMQDGFMVFHPDTKEERKTEIAKIEAEFDEFCSKVYNAGESEK